MRKTLCTAFSLILLFGLCACEEKTTGTSTQTVASESNNDDETTSGIDVIESVDSELYSEGEIASAIAVIENEFEAEWSGCTLTEIYYAGDITCRKYQEWADRYGADEVIVLLSSFDVDASGGDGSLNPNQTYKNWNWILVRANDGEWQHVDHGY